MAQLKPETWNGLRIVFLVPPFTPGQGGMQTICRHLSYLQAMGAHCTLVVLWANDTPRHYSDVLRMSYDCRPDKLHLSPPADEAFDIAVATLFSTVNFLPLFEGAVPCYFVQDKESLFRPVGDEHFEAEYSYQLGVPIITIGKWLAHDLARQYGAWTQQTDFSADERIYHPLDIRRERAICAIYQPEKPRRCSRLVEETLELVHAIAPDVKLVLYGSPTPPKLDFPVDFRGVLSKDECNLLYNQCMLGLSISSSNPSRIPFEMMASGLVPIDILGENTRYDLDPECAILAKANPAALATALLLALENDVDRERRSRNGLAFMKNRTHGIEEEAFARALWNIVSNEGPSGMPSSAASPESTSSNIDVVRSVGDALRMQRLFKLMTPPAMECTARYLLLHIEHPATLGNMEELRCYVWSQPGQADMQCFPASRLDDGTLVIQIDFDGFDVRSDLFVCHVYTRLDKVDTRIAEIYARCELLPDNASPHEDSPHEYTGENGFAIRAATSPHPIVSNDNASGRLSALARKTRRILGKG